MFQNSSMFTGIVEEIGVVKAISSGSVTVRSKLVLDGAKPGDSIAVNGACLTVIAIDGDGFSVEIMPETKRLTNIGGLHVGDCVNLERAMPAMGRFGGHFVQGHVDAVGKIASIEKEGEAHILTINLPEEIAVYLVKKGFIAVNGVSLTIISCSRSQFSVSLVGFTKQHTNLGTIRQGMLVNLEIDIIAKYIEKFYHPNKESGLISLLDRHDYMKAR